MKNSRCIIVSTLLNEIRYLIDWSSKNLNFNRICVEVCWSFSRRNSVSYHNGSFLDHKLFFSLASIEESFLSGNRSTFYEVYSDNSEIGSFVSDWKGHLKALVMHEVAHMIEVMGNTDSILGTSVKEYFNDNTPMRFRRKHHNSLWKKIYSEFRLNHFDVNTLEKRINGIQIIKECDTSAYILKMGGK